MYRNTFRPQNNTHILSTKRRGFLRFPMTQGYPGVTRGEHLGKRRHSSQPSFWVCVGDCPLITQTICKQLLSARKIITSTVHTRPRTWGGGPTVGPCEAGRGGGGGNRVARSPQALGARWHGPQGPRRASGRVCPVSTVSSWCGSLSGRWPRGLGTSQGTGGQAPH